MWRWVGIACLIYGFSTLGLIFSPRPAPPADPSIPPEFDIVPGGHPRALDFEEPFPLPITRPLAETMAVERHAGNHVLQWRLPPGEARIHVLALPMQPPGDATRLVLQVGGNRERELRIGLREEDGSVYLAPRTARQGLNEVALPLARLRLSGIDDDENSRLDMDQVTAVIIACPEPRHPRRDEGGPPVVLIDNIRFE